MTAAPCRVCCECLAPAMFRITPEHPGDESADFSCADHIETVLNDCIVALGAVVVRWVSNPEAAA